MWIIIAAVLVIVWLGSFVLLHVSSFLIHILLILAVISVIIHFMRGRRAS